MISDSIIQWIPDRGFRPQQPDPVNIRMHTWSLAPKQLPFLEFQTFGVYSSCPTAIPHLVSLNEVKVPKHKDFERNVARPEKEKYRHHNGDAAPLKIFSVRLRLPLFRLSRIRHRPEHPRAAGSLPGL
jgi:hypothetical protein